MRLDSADRPQWMARGLATPSYRDVVQNATLDAIARSGDSRYTATVDSLRGASARASLTLAVLAIRGDSAR